MKIVHLLSQTHLTGAESHALTLAAMQIADGHDVTVISDKIHLETKAKVILRPIHSARSFGRFSEVFKLKKILRAEGTDIVHTHSRAAVRIGWWATRGTKTALVSTIHGQQHISWGKKLFDTYGERIICVCENLRRHMIRDFEMRPYRLLFVGNPVRFSEASTERNPEIARWLLVSRWTGPKGVKTLEWLRDLAHPLLAQHPQLHLDICAAEPPPEAAAVLEKFKKEFGARFNFRGLIPEIEKEYPHYDLIIGGGRIAIGALGSGVDCFAFGEVRTPGLITEANIKRASDSNFGDVTGEVVEPDLRPQEALRQLKQRLQGTGDVNARAWLRDWVRERYDARRVHAQIMDVYKSARVLKYHPQPIPVLMYHQVTEAPVETEHRIWVTKNQFEKQVRTLTHRGVTFMDFRDLADFREGRRDIKDFPRMPVVLTFDDGYRNNLTNAVPILKKYNAKAVLYLLADASIRSNVWDEGEVPTSPLLSPEERREIAHSGVVEIGSHGFHHRKITLMTHAEAQRELSESKVQLEKELGVPVPSFAFTYGVIDERCPELAREAGYAYAVNTDRGGLMVEESPWAIFRVNIFPEDGMLALLKKSMARYRYRFLRKHGR